MSLRKIVTFPFIVLLASAFFLCAADRPVSSIREYTKAALY